MENLIEQRSFNDEVFELREIIHLSHNEKYKNYFSLDFGATCADGSVIVGRGGYLFVNDGSNSWKDQLNGNISIGRDVLDTTCEYIEECRIESKNRGVEFRFVAVPEKDVIYPELSPNSSQRASKRPIHEIIRELGAIVIYPELQLAKGKLQAPVFHARNSHYNIFGGLIVANNILDSLQLPRIVEENLSLEYAYWPDDLSIKWHDNLNTRRTILSKVYQEETINKPAGHVGTHLILKNDRARTEKKLMIFGDSYSWNPDAGIARYLTYEFSEVAFVWTKQVNWAEVEKFSPSAIILQSAERFLIKGLRK